MIRDRAFSSASTEKARAKYFGSNVFLKVRAPRGTKAADVSHLTGGGEREILLGRSTGLKVAAVRTTRSGKTMIVADVVR